MRVVMIQNLTVSSLRDSFVLDLTRHSHAGLCCIVTVLRSFGFAPDFGSGLRRPLNASNPLEMTALSSQFR